MIRAVIVAAALTLTAVAPVRADVLVVIDKSAQQIRVVVDGNLAHVFTTSTGMYGRGTPNGTYGVERLHRYWYSHKYDNAPMPYSIFYDGGYAIHGTTEISRLGRPASHGCVRLHPKDAAVLFALVREQGKENTTVVVTGTNPPKRKPPRASGRQRDRTPARSIPRSRGDPALRWWRER